MSRISLLSAAPDAAPRAEEIRSRDCTGGPVGARFDRPSNCGKAAHVCGRPQAQAAQLPRCEPEPAHRIGNLSRNRREPSRLSAGASTFCGRGPFPGPWSKRVQPPLSPLMDSAGAGRSCRYRGHGSPHPTASASRGRATRARRRALARPLRLGAARDQADALIRLHLAAEPGIRPGVAAGCRRHSITGQLKNLQRFPNKRSPCLATRRQRRYGRACWSSSSRSRTWTACSASSLNVG
jgi:hypothetical protein